VNTTTKDTKTVSKNKGKSTMSKDSKTSAVVEDKGAEIAGGAVNAAGAGAADAARSGDELGASAGGAGSAPSVLLESRDISYKYAGSKKNAISKINAEFEEGKVYAIIGRSGSGKSTFLSVLAGLDKPTSGKILFEGKDTQKIDRDDYRAQNIGVIFQGYNLLTNASAIDNIMLSMSISKVKISDKKEFALELLDKVGIDRSMADRKILKLSGGEQQRIAIARALSHQSNVIIADEPTGNLDSETEAQVLKLLQDIAHVDNKCVIIVTHSKKVTSIADKVYQMAKGNLSTN
jgi:putative ABC transport system ATP-binding protein